jgi:signal transduction histidine kinase
VTPVEGDLRALIHESVEIFQAPADARRILLEEIGGPPLLARFDHDRSLQVVANLIGNAIKFSPPGARISVRAEGVNGEMRVAVSDTGPGIRADNLEDIFGRFWQVGRRDRRGLGLGLYISRCIVQAQGGRIWAENGPASGSTFFFTVPSV